MVSDFQMVVVSASCAPQQSQFCCFFIFKALWRIEYIHIGKFAKGLPPWHYYSSVPCQQICDITHMQNKPLRNLALGDCVTNNWCFLKAHKQALQRDFARDLLLCGKKPIPDCTMSFLMPLRVFWGLFNVFQGCWVLCALLLCPKVLASFLAFAVACIALFLLLFWCWNLLFLTENC